MAEEAARHDTSKPQSRAAPGGDTLSRIVAELTGSRARALDTLILGALVQGVPAEDIEVVSAMEGDAYVSRVHIRPRISVSPTPLDAGTTWSGGGNEEDQKEGPRASPTSLDPGWEGIPEPLATLWEVAEAFEAQSSGKERPPMFWVDLLQSQIDEMREHVEEGRIDKAWAEVADLFSVGWQALYRNGMEPVEHIVNRLRSRVLPRIDEIRETYKTGKKVPVSKKHLYEAATDGIGACVTCGSDLFEDGNHTGRLIPAAPTFRLHEDAKMVYDKGTMELRKNELLQLQEETHDTMTFYSPRYLDTFDISKELPGYFEQLGAEIAKIEVPRPGEMFRVTKTVVLPIEGTGGIVELDTDDFFTVHSIIGDNLRFRWGPRTVTVPVAMIGGWTKLRTFGAHRPPHLPSSSYGDPSKEQPHHTSRAGQRSSSCPEGCLSCRSAHQEEVAATRRREGRWFRRRS